MQEQVTFAPGVIAVVHQGEGAGVGARELRVGGKAHVPCAGDRSGYRIFVSSLHLLWEIVSIEVYDAFNSPGTSSRINTSHFPPAKRQEKCVQLLVS